MVERCDRRVVRYAGGGVSGIFFRLRREEVRFRIRVEINAERISNHRLAPAQAVDVVVAIAMIEHSRLAHLHTRDSLAGEQTADFLLRIIEARKQLPPNLVKPFEPRRQFSAGRQTVVRSHKKMVGTYLPTIFDVGMPRRIDPALRNQRPGRFRSDPTFLSIPSLAGLA